LPPESGLGRTVDSAQVWAPVPPVVKPPAPVLKFSLNTVCATAPPEQSPGAGCVRKLNTAEFWPAPQILLGRTRQ
jgi:hypothetical protein